MGVLAVMKLHSFEKGSSLVTDPEQSAYIRELRRSITAEASLAAGLHPGSWQDRLFSLFFWLPAQRFASMGAKFDEEVEKSGLITAVDSLVSQYINEVRVHGKENIPPDGPLVIASNHPGAFDGLAIITKVRRNDLKLIISDVPFTRTLNATSSYLIFSTGQNLQERMTAVRQSMRHLRNNGSLLVFPTGLVDPDPAFMSRAEDSLRDWSASLVYFLEKVPGLSILPTIVSGVLAPKYLNNPLARTQTTTRKRQKVAEYLEIAQMMVLQRKLDLTPCISFGKPLSSDDITSIHQQHEKAAIIHEHALKLLAQHRTIFYSDNAINK